MEGLARGESEAFEEFKHSVEELLKELEELRATKDRGEAVAVATGNLVAFNFALSAMLGRVKRPSVLKQVRGQIQRYLRHLLGIIQNLPLKLKEWSIEILPSPLSGLHIAVSNRELETSCGETKSLRTRVEWHVSAIHGTERTT